MLPAVLLAFSSTGIQQIAGKLESQTRLIPDKGRRMKRKEKRLKMIDMVMAGLNFSFLAVRVIEILDVFKGIRE